MQIAAIKIKRLFLPEAKADERPSAGNKVLSPLRGWVEVRAVPPIPQEARNGWGTGRLLTHPLRELGDLIWSSVGPAAD
jgi:hypothetical protein